MISSFPHWHQFLAVCHLFDWKILKFVFPIQKLLGTRHCGTLVFHHSQNLSTKNIYQKLNRKNLLRKSKKKTVVFKLLTTKLQCWHPMILAFAILISGGSFFAFNPSTNALMRDHHWRSVSNHSCWPWGQSDP